MPANPTQDPAADLRLRCDVAYDGTDFSGWARQPGQRTVQGVLEETLETILRTPVRLTVAGRTDTGVHATGQVCHLDIPAAALDTRSIAGDPRTLVRRTARMLPDDVRLLDCSLAPPGFDARFGALRRHYSYRVTSSPSGPLPTRARDTAAWPRRIDRVRATAAARRLLGLNDFAAFCRYRDGATTVRELQEFTWELSVEGPDEHPIEVLTATVVADAFCWSMVRSLVGACLTVGDGRRDPEWMDSLLDERRRSPSVPVAEARGLTLTRVDYPADQDLLSRQEVTRGLREEIPPTSEA